MFYYCRTDLISEILGFPCTDFMLTLFNAIKANNAETVDSLLKTYPCLKRGQHPFGNVSVVELESFSLVDVSTCHGAKAVLDVLKKHGFPVPIDLVKSLSQEAALYALQIGNNTLFNEWVEKHPDKLTSKDQSLLEIVAKMDLIEGVKILLKHRARVNLRLTNGSTPFVSIVKYGINMPSTLKIIRILINKGCGNVFDEKIKITELDPAVAEIILEERKKKHPLLAHKMENQEKKALQIERYYQFAENLGRRPCIV